MAIYLPRTDSILLEVPKTGSKWLREAVARAGVPSEQVGPPEWRGHGDLGVHGRGFRFIACFVRNPLTWYGSYFVYRMEKNGWRPHLLLDRTCASDTFRGFVRNAATRIPGVVSDTYARYAGQADDPVHFVGRQESLADDLVRALRMAGEEFDEAALRATPRVNGTRATPELTPDLEHLIVLSELPAMRRFGYLDGYDDPVALVELSDRYPEHATTLRHLAIWTDRIHWVFDDAKAEAGAPIRMGRRYARTLTNFGLFLENVVGCPEEAEPLYLRAIEAEPRHPRSLGTYAVFLQNVRADHDRAEEYYRRALEVRPDHAEALGNYAIFLRSVRGDLDGAEALYRRAIKANPRHAKNLGNYALFLKNARQDHDGAEAYYRRALEVEPDNARNLGNFAVFLEHVRGDADGAERMYRRAVDADPDNPHHLRNLAAFLENRRSEAGEAERLRARPAAAPVA
ncbi:MAG TPA: tetratricopeptide repeat protein [Longimicrobiaceae bacterium]|nr:tetratricopeptide repeat protein [Longimicrobiaceae bacterium]